MSSRKPHRKSRTGCQTCKKRHVKCGEERPSCNNCLEYEMQCSYLLAPAPATVRYANKDNEISSIASSSSSLNGVQDGVKMVDPMLLKPSSTEQDLNTSDLELLHHFSTVTFKTMSNVPSEQHQWQTTIVKIGLSNLFLLRGLLALSALHLAYLIPARSLHYLIKAATHQDIALSQFRQELSSINNVNFDALLAYSCLLPIQGIAIAASSSFQTHILSQEPDQLSAFIKSIHLLRSVNKILLPSVSEYPTSNLLPLLQITNQPQLEASVFPGMEFFEGLEAKCTNYTNLISSFGSQTHANIYRATISQLKTTFAKVSPENSKEKFRVGIILIWTILVSDDYISLLDERDKSAMAILAYFAALLQDPDCEDVWWLEGVGSSLIRTINGELGKEWEEVMRWPNMVAESV